MDQTVSQLTVSQFSGLVLGLTIIGGMIVYFIGQMISSIIDISALFIRPKKRPPQTDDRPAE